MSMWPFTRRRLPPPTLGRLGEHCAAWFYRLRGWRVLARNLRLAAGEIDLVLQRGARIVIAEVKARQTRTAGEGHEAVGPAKRDRLIRLGDQYLARHPDARLQYDVVSLFWTGRRFVVQRYADAFRPIADADAPWRWRSSTAGQYM